MLSEKTPNQAKQDSFMLFTPISNSVLQRKCACGTHTMGGGQCAECQKKKMGVGERLLQTKLMISEPGDAYEQEADRVAGQVMRMSPTDVSKRQSGNMTPPLVQRRATATDSATGLAEPPPAVREVLNSLGQPLSTATRAYFEPRFGQDFSGVHVHTDGKVAESAEAVSSLAYTVGNDVVFGTGQYAPGTVAGRRMLAHELAHSIQQSTMLKQEQVSQMESNSLSVDQRVKGNADQAAVNLMTGQRILAPASNHCGGPLLQRQVHGTPSPISVHSPVFEEFVTQASTAQAGLEGRPLDAAEIRLARSVFGASIDYSRVRLIPTGILEYRTVANFIRVPEKFTIADEYMAQTLIHELTHVWQYQHGGTSYISISLAAQIAGTLRTGSRNAAYDYQITPGASFFKFTPEQQGLIVENYFAMLRDQNASPRQWHCGNHLDGKGNFRVLSASDRMAEITRELPLHQPLIKQMQTALPLPEVSLLTARATEVMRTSFESAAPVPAERQMVPVKPLLELRF